MTQERLLDFFFKKGGTVNLSNIKYLVDQSNTVNNLSKCVNGLKADGLIKSVDSHHFKLTTKARHQKIYKSPAWIFWCL